MKHQLDCYEDFYGCTYSVRHQPDGTFRMAAHTPRGNLFHMKIYSTKRGCMIALGKLSEGTARKTMTKEVV